ncbi:MAG: FtsX-like permease family protein [Candidatus Thorarchaeota archaeon]
MRKNTVMTAGIVVMLAFGVALPSTVFTWSSTGIGLSVRNYFEDNTYQLRIGYAFQAVPTQNLLDISFMNGYRENQLAAMEMAASYPFVERTDLVPSTIGLVFDIDGTTTVPEDTSYWMWNQNYRDGFKDCRAIVTDNELLDRWEREFEYQGKFNVSHGEVLVSEQFIDYTRQVHGIVIGLGSNISLGMVRHIDYHYYGTIAPEMWFQNFEESLTVVGIYKLKSVRSLIGEVFPSLSRRNWDPLGLAEPVLGIDDSVIVSKDLFTEYDYWELSTYSMWHPAGLVRGSPEVLTAMGAENIETVMIEMSEHIQSAIQHAPVYGIQNLDELQSVIDNFILSRGLAVLSFPILMMSVLLTVFVSELSIQNKKSDLRAIRAKGASYSQVTSALLWEASLITLGGLIFGIILSIFLSPMMGASTGLFAVDMSIFTDYFYNTRISEFGLLVSSIIAVYLPFTFMVQIARSIDVLEIGQVDKANIDDMVESKSSKQPVAIFAGSLIALVMLPILFDPVGWMAYAEILIVTLLLFSASVTGSRLMRGVVSKIASMGAFVLGERQLYVTKSLRKRKGQFLPIFLLLTLTLSVTSMTLIQLSSFQTTLDNELSFAIGADLRVTCPAKPVHFTDELMNYPGVLGATSVIESLGHIASFTFFIEGIRPLEYSEVCSFRPDCFVNGTAESIMGALNSTPNGIVISEYMMNHLNVSVGDSIYITADTRNGSTILGTEIVGAMTSAPGFGIAATEELQTASLAAQIGFQSAQGGFALVNQDFVVSRTRINTTSLFFVDTTCWSDNQYIIQGLEREIDTHVYSLDTFDFSKSNSINLFLSAFNGVSSVILFSCISMGLASIMFFLGSAVLERKQEYAVMRALGATRKQLVTMVFNEFALAVIAATIISLLLGILFGYAMSLMTIGVAPFSTSFAPVLDIPIPSITLTILGEVVVLILSCYIPARKAGMVNPAMALRNL